MVTFKKALSLHLLLHYYHGHSGFRASETKLSVPTINQLQWFQYGLSPSKLIWRPVLRPAMLRGGRTFMRCSDRERSALMKD